MDLRERVQSLFLDSILISYLVWFLWLLPVDWTKHIAVFTLFLQLLHQFKALRSLFALELRKASQSFCVSRHDLKFLCVKLSMRILPVCQPIFGWLFPNFIFGLDDVIELHLLLNILEHSIGPDPVFIEFLHLLSDLILVFLILTLIRVPAPGAVAYLVSFFYILNILQVELLHFYFN